MAVSLPVPDVRPLFPGERAALLSLLAALSGDDWTTATACSGWSVKDIVSHLLADDLGRLSAGRDGYTSRSFAEGFNVATFDGLVLAIDRQNEEWVRATRRLSPQLLIRLVQLSGEATVAYFADLELDALGGPVEWAGPDAAPRRLDFAREYTERWVHQQHIRDALDRPGLKEPRWLAPVLATFAHALPRSLGAVEAEEGTAVQMLIRGPAGGDWTVCRHGASWRLTSSPAEPSASVALDQEVAWRLFTKGISRDVARSQAELVGDPVLAERLLETVAVLA